jgi:lysozyme
MSDEGIEQLKRHEGYRDKIYKCPAGFNTLGYGHNIDANPLSTVDSEFFKRDARACSESLLRGDIVSFVNAIKAKKSFVDDFSQPRQDALINLTYNMGAGWLTLWSDTWRQIKMEQWVVVGNDIRRSKYARQVGQRASELAAQLESGVYA